VKPPVAVIAEDEPLLRAEVRRSLGELWPELAIAAEAADGLQAVEALERHAPDVLFLDIHMPGLDGLEVARRAGGRAHVVFITAFEEHAVAAFEHGAVDYLLKPFSRERMERAVARLRKHLSEPPATLENLVKFLKDVAAGDRGYLQWLTVPHGTELRVVAVPEICFLRSEGKYTSVATRDSTFLLSTPLKDLREKLDPRMFWQIHRGIVVNVSAIDTIFRSFRGALELKIKDRNELLPVSASHAHQFRRS
jgi:DNA-binding LytR/AlgR family response regulator